MTSQTADTRVDPRSRIIVSAARLLSESGAPAVTTRAVAGAAGVPPSVIFRLFGDKGGLMEAVAEHVMGAYVAEKSCRAKEEDGDPVEDLRRAWRTHVEFGLANPDLFVLLSSPSSRDSAANTTGAQVLHARLRRVAAAGRLAVSESDALGLIHAAGTGSVLALLQRPPSERDASLPETMLNAVLKTILTSTPAPSTSSLTPLINVFSVAIADLPALTDAERQLMHEWISRSRSALTG